MTDLSRVGLGTVQFGMHYGVSNRVGPTGRARGGGDPGACRRARCAISRHGVGLRRCRNPAGPTSARRPPLAHRHQDAAGAGRAHRRAAQAAVARCACAFARPAEGFGGVRPARSSGRRPGQARLAVSRRGIAGGADARSGLAHRRVGLRREAIDAGGKPVSPRSGPVAAERARPPADRVRRARAPEGAGQSRCMRARSSCRAFCSRRRPICRTSSSRCASGWWICAADGRGADCRRSPRVLPSCCGRRRSTRRSWA